MAHGSAMPRAVDNDSAEMPHNPILLALIDYPFVATVEGEFIALRAIVRLHQRDGVWAAILLDGERHELEASVARTILDQGPFDRAYVPSTLFESPMAHGATHGLAHGQHGPHGPL